MEEVMAMFSPGAEFCVFKFLSAAFLLAAMISAAVSVFRGLSVGYDTYMSEYTIYLEHAEVPVKLEASLARDPTQPGLTNQELFELYQELMQDNQRVIGIATAGQMQRYKKLKSVCLCIRLALICICGSFIFQAISMIL